MNRPPFLVRLAGYPPMAILLFFGYAAVVWDWWYRGGVPWWLAVGAVAAAGRTLGAVGRMRRYKAWLAAWQAMGAKDEPSPPKKKRRWMFIIGAALLAVAIPVCLPPKPGNETTVAVLTILWFGACLYLVFTLVRAVLRRRAKRRKAKAEVAPVAWLVGRPSSSPSRSEAERNLPEYCARLLAK